VSHQLSYARCGATASGFDEPALTPVASAARVRGGPDRGFRRGEARCGSDWPRLPRLPRPLRRHLVRVLGPKRQHRAWVALRTSRESCLKWNSSSCATSRCNCTSLSCMIVKSTTGCSCCCFRWKLASRQNVRRSYGCWSSCSQRLSFVPIDRAVDDDLRSNAHFSPRKRRLTLGHCPLKPPVFE